MSQKSSISLPSGRYEIRALVDGSFMSDQTLTGFRDAFDEYVVTNKYDPFQWDVHHVDHKGYIIQIPQQENYIVTKKEAVEIGSSQQVYDIVRTSSDRGEECYRIQALERETRLFRWNGDGNKVTAELVSAKDKIDSRFLWKFEPVPVIAPPSPYSIYSKNFDYFNYSSDGKVGAIALVDLGCALPEGGNSNLRHVLAPMLAIRCCKTLTSVQLLDHFGLKCDDDDLANRWVDFWKVIDRLNRDAKGSIIYKVVFLARHAEGLHNLLMRKEKKDHIKHEWLTPPRYDFKTNGDNNFTWMDAELTQTGYLQACNVQATWTQELAAGIGLPQISYCSPLTRCLQTNTITFGQTYSSDSPFKTTVLEGCRERCSGETPEKRRTKTYISTVFPKFDVPEDFAEGDPLFSKMETRKDVKLRALAVLDRIFKSESTRKRFVSITSHAGFNKAFITALGGKSQSFYFAPASVIPLICLYTPDIKDGFYKIQYIYNELPDHSKDRFADGFGIGSPVKAMEEKTTPSTTWFVKCLNAEARVYTIELVENDEELRRQNRQRSFWNLEQYTTTPPVKDPKVVLLTEQRAWAILRSKEPGLFSIGNIPPTPGEPNFDPRVVEVDTQYDLTLTPEQQANSGACWRFIPVQV